MEWLIIIMKDFTYLGSTLSAHGEKACEVDCRIAKASKAFGSLSLLRELFSIYDAVIVSILLCGAETWTLKAPGARRLTVFHNVCLRTILGVSRFKQWNERNTS